MLESGKGNPKEWQEFSFCKKHPANGPFWLRCKFNDGEVMIVCHAPSAAAAAEFSILLLLTWPMEGVVFGLSRA